MTVEIIAKTIGVAAVLAVGFTVCYLTTVMGKEMRMVQKKKRFMVTIGQPLEIEYEMDGSEIPDVEIKRIFAYTGAVRVDISALLRTNDCRELLKKIEARCYQAEGIAEPIPF